jgi:hypothetical protein
VARVPRGTVDRARDSRHQRAQQRIVGALLDGAQPGPHAREQLRAGERAVQVVVGADVELALAAAHGEQPRAADPGILAEGDAGTRGVHPARLAIDDHDVGRVLVERLQRRLRAAHGAGHVALGVQPGAGFRFDGTDQQHAGLAPPD